MSPTLIRLFVALVALLSVAVLAFLVMSFFWSGGT
jgi:hypothetical protein